MPGTLPELVALIWRFPPLYGAVNLGSALRIIRSGRSPEPLDRQVTASFADARTANRAALAAAAIAFWLAGTGSSAQAGCGDYLVGVDNSAHAADAPLTPVRKVPECRSCHEPATPIAPVIVVERVPIDSALIVAAAAPTFDRCGWHDAESTLQFPRLSEVPNRPPKI